MTTLTPEQLPNGNAQFIAYGNATRVADPFGGDDAISVRPQVFVRYYRGIKIRALREPNEDTVHVVLDPESVGLEKEFGAYMNSDDPVVTYLHEQYEAGNPIDIGIEFVRRQKAKDSKAEISPLAPIHALRGAENPDGTGNNAVMMGASGNHIRAIVGLINGRRTTVTESDPREWKILTGNRKGDLPPEGWKALLDREDWSQLGAITPRDGATASQASSEAQQPQGGTQGLDMNALSKIISHEVRKGLKDYGEHLLRQEEATRDTPSHGTSAGVEGKPWNVWVTKDQLNLGSYLVAGEGYALRWAFTYLGAINDSVLNDDTEIRWEAARELADASQKIADQVQATAYNGEVRADRTSASFKEAVLWVRFHIETAYPFSAADDFDFDQWYSNVGRAATTSLKTAEASAFDFLAERYPKAENATASAPERPEAPRSAPSASSAQSAGSADAPAQSEGDRTPVIAAYLQLLTQGWNDRDRIFELAREAKAKGLIDTTVYANPRDGEFSSEPFDGGREITIGHLTKRQYSLLSQAADTGDDSAQAPEPEPTPQEAPEEASAPVAAEPEQAEAAAQAGTEQAAAQQPQGKTAQHIAAALAKATTEDQIATCYTQARENNLLTSEVSVQHGAGHFGLTPVRPNTEGAETMQLGAVFDALRAAVETGQPEAQTAEPAQAPEEATEEAPAPQEAPQDQGPAEKQEEEKAPAQVIAERALDATTPEEIAELYTEAQQQGVESETVTIRGGSGPLGSFLNSRKKRAERSAQSAAKG